MFSLASFSDWVKFSKTSGLSLILGAGFFIAPLILPPSQAAAQNSLQLNEGIFRPGDSVAVTIDKVESLSQDYDVDHQGFVDFQYLGKINVNGLSPTGVSRQLTELYSRDYLNNPKIDVKLIPGDNSTALIPDNTVTDDTFTGNTITDDTPDLSFPFSIDSFLGPNTSSEATTQSPSIVRPDSLPIRRVILSGGVAQPGIYALTENKPLSVVLQRAGGLNSNADLDEIIVFRGGADGSRTAYFVEYSSVLSGDLIDPIITPGDFIFIKSDEDNFDWAALQQIISIIDVPLDIAFNAKN